MGFFVMGGLDPFVLNVLMKSAMISFVFAVIVGIPFYRKRLKEISKNKQRDILNS
jgi:heme exporter protein D